MNRSLSIITIDLFESRTYDLRVTNIHKKIELLLLFISWTIDVLYTSSIFTFKCKIDKRPELTWLYLEDKASLM